MSYELEGTLKEVFETRTFGKGFTKREFVVTTSKGADDRYPQHIKLCVVKDKVTLLDRFRPGQRLKIQFDLRGNESNGRYFNEIQAWRVEAAEGGGHSSAEESGGKRHADYPPSTDYHDGEEDSRRGGGGGKRAGGPRPHQEHDDYDDGRRGGFRGGRDDEMPF